MPPRLTERRVELLRTLSRLEAKLGRPPSTAELAAALGVSAQGVAVHLQSLVKLGLLSKSGRYGPHSLTEGGRDQVGDGVPVLGEIAAGAPILAEERRDLRAERLSDLLDLQGGGLPAAGAGGLDAGGGHLRRGHDRGAALRGVPER